MPRREDIKKVLVIGSGPIVIGQAVEFDYSGTQAIKALREEGVEVVLLNSNPASVMTDPDLAHRTYVEPITLEVAERIIAVERPDSLLPTMGGQTALNLAKALAEAGVLERHGVRLIGASLEAIDKAEDRQKFKAAMERIGLQLPRSGVATSLEQVRAIARDVGFPAIVRPSFTLGGTGGGIAYNGEELEGICRAGLAASPTGTVLIEESVLGWKEYELEVVRDCADNVIIVCSIENLDPMGVHTGDSITVAPAQTLTDKEYQALREASLRVIREIGVDTGGSNIQFGVNPVDGRVVVIEMNPRVSRSSALASKATGYPIAKIAAKLALGFTLDELRNDITRDTTAAFEPAIDYVVVKIPRFNFEKFPGADRTLTTTMRSVGEVMAIGRTFQEAYLKALRSLELGRLPLAPPPLPEDPGERRAALEQGVRVPTPERPWFVAQAFREGLSVEEVNALSAIDPWFLRRIAALVTEAGALAPLGLSGLTAPMLLRLKRLGFSDAELASNLGATEQEVRELRHASNLRPRYKRVDTCAGEFEAFTPYFYSSYDEEDEAPPTSRTKVMILGSGPIHIGQGVEFDYCCVHAALALREAGYETVMVNCNPETVSTDYDTSDRLYFEPLTAEDVANVLDAEGASGEVLGVIVSLGGQTPLKLSHALPKGMVLGTSPDSIDLAEDRERWNALCARLEIPQPAGALASTLDQALAAIDRIGYPALVRPSYVLGGRAMSIVYDEQGLRDAMAQLAGYGSLGKEGGLSAERPVLIDRFLEDAIEVDVDALRDATGEVVIGGVMEHVEEAGVHSGDSACAIPPPTLPHAVVEVIEEYTRAIADALDVRGLLNVQYAVKHGQVFVIEANPRASRTVPFVAKATGVPLAKVAARVMAGATLAELRDEGVLRPPVRGGHVSVKEAVLPFNRFPDIDTVLGPEMRSTGEVMGIDATFGLAFAKSQIAAGDKLPEGGGVFLSLADRDKAGGVLAARRFAELGFSLVATSGTAAHLEEQGIGVDQVVAKVGEDAAGRPTALDLIASGKVDLVVNTPRGSGPRADGEYIRLAAGVHRIPCITTVAAAIAAANGMADWAAHDLQVRTLQEFHAVDQLDLGL